MMILVAFIALFILLFSFHYFSKDDYFFIRKGITMEQLFNVLFIGLFWSIVVARGVFALLNPANNLLSPLTFILIPYFAGLSMLGGIVGAFISYIFLTKRKKIHTGRFLDYFSIAAVSAMPVLLFGNYILQEDKAVLDNVYLASIYIVLFFIFTKVLFPRFQRGLLKEGSMSLLFLILFSLISLFNDIILLYKNAILLHTEDFLFIGLFFIASMLLVRSEMRKSSK